MTTPRKSIHGQWSGRSAFVLAAAGSAVGLSNIWKFPYITGENGGGTFVLVYLACVVMIGIPIMIAEIMLGRRGQLSPVNTMECLASEERRSDKWFLLGWMEIAAGFLIFSYYSMIAGWALSYVFRVGSGMFAGATADGVNSIFSTFVSDPERMLAWHTIFMVMTIIVVSRGVRNGLEKAVSFMMPVLFMLLLLLLSYAMTTGHFIQGFDFLFKLGKISSQGVLVAMGHAFFTLSLGMGAIMAYGSYLPKEVSITRAVLVVAIVDTAVALVAGLVIFPIVFAHGLAPDVGPGLIFRTLPIAFGHMEGGRMIGVAFFVLLVLAAWTSAISLVEPAVAWLVEKRGVTRVYASVTVGVLAWLVGLGSIFSFNIWKNKTLTIPYLFRDKTFYGLVDGLTANIMLPLGGLFIAIFTAWLMRESSSREELATLPVVYTVWRFLTRFVTPVAVLIVFLSAIGVIKP